MSKSSELYLQAKKLMPGGVNSPVRAFHAVDGDPIFISRGEGAYLYDADGNQYIDYVCSWGPLILGHAHPFVTNKVIETLQRGYSFGASTEMEICLAQKIKECMPTMEMMRFVSSGTEAVMSAIRLARSFTKRNKIIKFKGCYHGHADSLLVAAGSGGLTFSIPSSGGVPLDFIQHTLVANYNRLEEVADLFKQVGHEIAAVIVEPIAGNMNLVKPLPDFLPGLRSLCDQYNSLLIFDEVITGFRVGMGGAQAFFNIKPDLTILGKIVGGGFPAAVFGGRTNIMEKLAPLGEVYQAGTLSGNPVAMSAGYATLEMLSVPGFYTRLIENTTYLTQCLNNNAKKAGVPFHAVSIGAMFGIFFTELTRIETEQDVKQSQLNLFKKFFKKMLAQGIYLAPSAYEIGFMSAAHEKHDIEKTCLAANNIFIEDDFLSN